jgi:hypothetical protein
MVRGLTAAGLFPEGGGADGFFGLFMLVEELPEEDGARKDRISSANSLSIW